jgi:hypothetical protein
MWRKLSSVTAKTVTSSTKLLKDVYVWYKNTWNNVGCYVSHYNHTIHVAVIRRVTKILRYFAPSPCNNIKRNETTKICDHVKGNSHYRGLLSITTDCNQSINQYRKLSLTTYKKEAGVWLRSVTGVSFRVYLSSGLLICFISYLVNSMYMMWGNWHWILGTVLHRPFVFHSKASDFNGDRTRLTPRAPTYEPSPSYPHTI